ncbi:TIGR03086 family metal-binding protein [Sphaerisporangium dianthi]|uniref:TIGR03086 family metal-binding protein n=1 Tax=Sphaerisporangium dianthi TaxID=1436120 RepID=A0ABV9CTM8_9ACTN
MHGDDRTLLSIGELAERTGMSVKLIRHWSDIGVVPPASRTAAGYRLYAPEAVARLELARALRDLGLGMAAIKDVAARERDLGEVAAVHADALEVHIRTLRSRQAVLRSITARGTTAERLAVMTRLARLSSAERNAVVREFVADAVGDADAPAYRAGLLAALPELPREPTAEQVDAWLELGELMEDPALRSAMRHMAEYAARHALREHDEDDVREAERVTDLWVGQVTSAAEAGLAADSPAAEPVVAAVVAAWLPTQARVPGCPEGDGVAARRMLLEQLENAADARLERYWQLMCVINDRPVRPSMAAAGRWLTTALRANAEPGARATRVAAILGDGDGDGDGEGEDAGPAGILDGCARVLADVGELVAAVPPGHLGDPTPCEDWDVRALLDHLVWENLLWTSLAEGVPRSDFAADHLGGDHVAAFRAAAEATMAAFGRPGMLTRRYGPAPGWRLVEQVVIEMIVHGWDLATAIGRPADLVPDVATAIMPSVREIYGDLPRTPGGSFAPERPAPVGATPADRLAAYLGRPLGSPRRPRE